MPTIRLPHPLPDEAVLWSLNRQLVDGGGPLDWQDVRPAGGDAFTQKLRVLLNDLDLADDADALGLDSVPAALETALLALLDVPAPRRRVSRRISGANPATWVPGADGGDRALKAPAPAELREKLEKAVIADLLGPAGGAYEEIDERSVQDRYLVGMLAPLHQSIDPSELERVAREVGDNAEEGPSEAEAPPAKSLLPSSFGLSFCVSAEASAVVVTARWGHYDRMESETQVTEKGNPRTVWRRVPVQGSTRPIPLVDGPVFPQPIDARWPEVTVQGIVRRLGADFVVTVFLVNGQTAPLKSRDVAWLFQAELEVCAPDGAAIFQRRPLPRPPSDAQVREEAEGLAMLYRDDVEFAVGHGVGVHAETAPGNRELARRLLTRAVPLCEVPQQAPPTAAQIPELAELVLDMKTLAECSQDRLEAALKALPHAYETWIEAEEEKARHGAEGLGPHRDAARRAMRHCRDALERIRDGVSLLATNRQAAEAFRFANHAMWFQRVHSIYAEQARRGKNPDLTKIDVPENRTWYPFQLAFILLNLPSLTDLYHPHRSAPRDAMADLLWFPTGGGKTEAYLGLAAYTMAIRRLQGDVAGRSGQHGIAVLMRYTLRLLTIQQFQRASALICACEAIRREALAQGDPRWGQEPFRIGLWVGMHTTPNTTEQAAEWLRQNRGVNNRFSGGGSGSPAQLTYCPWCGSPVDPARDIQVSPVKQGVGRTFLYCGDRLGRCLFSRKQAPEEGLPVVVVDEEIYRRLPTMLIATVDKFAQLPWNGVTQMLFGQVDGRCTRHGFRSPDLDDSDTHPKGPKLQAARTLPHGPLRPPDLIIQDELHLISGPLGTLVGLYETAVDQLCSWEVGGKRIRPKVIASTATIRRAPEQVRALFMRRVEVFPPHGTHIQDNFFSRRQDPKEVPGRLYLGICAPGRRLKAAQIRVLVALMAGARQLYDRYGAAADPWMTLVGYYSAMRELAGARRLIEDDVRSRLRDADRRGLARRPAPLLEELTSRKSSSEIPRLLDLLEVPFDPAEERQRREQRKLKQRSSARPLDVLLATNMISVGVDVKRLGLMLVTGQPKNTAEYIQATSRVGRASPGLVVTIFNWARPRDLSHYEKFEHYHATFYQHVEALSVTPFAPRAVDRGLTALLVALTRLNGQRFNPNEAAQDLQRDHRIVKDAITRIVDRAREVGDGEETATEVRAMLETRINQWLYEAQQDVGTRLGYKADPRTRPLLRPAGAGPWELFTCLNSLRDVEATVPLILEDPGRDDGPPYQTMPRDGGS